jgi:outer membrane protein TolC
MGALGTILLVALCAQGEPQRLTLNDAVKAALEASASLRAARARADATEDQAKSHRGRLLPSINLSDEQQHWDSAFNVTFYGLTPPGVPAPSLTARNVNTNTFVAAVGQPVLGMLKLTHEQAALSRQAEAADFEVQTAEANLRDEVQTQFVRLFEARALGGIAKASQGQLAEQIQTAKDKLAAGVLTLADVLRLEVAAANARQQEIQADAAEQVARAALLIDLGRDPQDASVEFVEPSTPETADPTEAKLADLVEHALGKRTEVQAALRQADSARLSSRARIFDLLPDVDFEAGYVHVNGQIFAPRDAGFLGVKAGWQVWDWGARWYQSRAAEHQANAAAALAEDARRRVQLDVAARHASVRATGAALETGRTAVASAEEAYRVTTVLLAAGSANTTDLLDAQSALTQARLTFARARFEYALARMSLARALGE